MLTNIIKRRTVPNDKKKFTKNMNFYVNKLLIKGNCPPDCFVFLRYSLGTDGKRPAVRHIVIGTAVPRAVVINMLRAA
jgi:hypothetical protein